jgi:hypothetical protein
MLKVIKSIVFIFIGIFSFGGILKHNHPHDHVPENNELHIDHNNLVSNIDYGQEAIGGQFLYHNKINI